MIIKIIMMGVLTLIMPLIGDGCGCGKESPGGQTTSTPKIVSVDEVVNAPDQYKGFIGIEGTVTSVSQPDNLFLLGCADSCISMPVRYNAQMPELKSQVTIYGEIQKEPNGKYFFLAKEIKTK